MTGSCIYDQHCPRGGLAVCDLLTDGNDLCVCVWGVYIQVQVILCCMLYEAECSGKSPSMYHIARTYRGYASELV